MAGHDGHTINLGPVHKGRHVDSGEPYGEVWECDDDCPHPEHSCRCSYCKKPADGSHHDVYGEYVLRRDDLVLCDACADDFDNEPEPWIGD